MREARLMRKITVAGAVAGAVIAIVFGVAQLRGDEDGSARQAARGPLITASAEALTGRCSGKLFLPKREAARLTSTPPPTDLTPLYMAAKVAPVGEGAVRVSIQGTGRRVITLTGVEFKSARASRPDGVAFDEPCGGPLVGRLIEVDVDRDVPRIIDGNGLGGAGASSYPRTKPIRFPWTVSVTDPLILYIQAVAESCLCTWRAVISWTSGSARGTIDVSDRGKGFRVVGDEPPISPVYVPMNGTWEQVG
jgi:hypothetical protein